MAESKLTQKKNNLRKALTTLTIILDKVHVTPTHDENFIFFRDSLIQRFEYSVDIFWKLLREVIMHKHGLEVIASPKVVLKQALDLTILNQDQYMLMLKAINDRNLSSHAYHEELAQEIATHIQVYYHIMDEVCTTIAPMDEA